ncbi:RNA polymerase sigma-H factor [subsurface metagenome]
MNPQITDKNPSPETKLLQKEFKDRVRETLEHLPDAYNIVIKMHYFEGFSYPEISRASGIPVNTIKSHIFRAKKIIKSRLEAYVEE